VILRRSKKPTIEEKRNNYQENVSFLEKQKRISENIIQEYNIQKVEINKNIDNTIKKLEEYIKLVEIHIADHNKARIGTLEGLARQTIKDSRIPDYASRYAVIDTEIEPRNDAEEKYYHMLMMKKAKLNDKKAHLILLVKEVKLKDVDIINKNQ
jgi:hypothetical protein